MSIRAAVMILMAALAAVPGIAHASEAWPTKPVRFVVPVTPGGAPDRVARLLSDRLQKKWGQPVLIENKPGAGLIIGTELVARAPADGYTILNTLTAHVQTPFLFKKLPFDTVRDFVPITQTAEVDVLFSVRADLPYKTFQEFLAAARSANPPISFGSTGQGSTYHLNGVAIQRAAGVSLLHVPYKGEVQALTDLVAGRIDASFASFPTMVPMVNAGRIRPLAIIATSRSAVFPELPSVAEHGVTRLNSWFGLLAPRGTPNDIVQKISADVREILTDAAVARPFAEQGIRTIGSTPEQFAQMIEASLAAWKKIIAETGLQPGEI